MTLYWPSDLDVSPQVPRRQRGKKRKWFETIRNGYFDLSKHYKLWPWPRSHVRIVGFWTAPDGVTHVKKVNVGDHAHPHHTLTRTGCGKNRDGSFGGDPTIMLAEFTAQWRRVDCPRCIKVVDEWAANECPIFRAMRAEAARAAKAAREERRIRRRERKIWHRIFRR